MNQKSKVKEVTFEKEDCTFFVGNESLLNDMPGITKNRSAFLSDSKCDGVVFMLPEDNEEKLCLVELKSNFDTRKIQEALSQNIHSLLKLHAMLSLCDGYDWDQLSIELIVACQCFKDKDQEGSVMLNLNKLKQQNEFGKSLYKLVKDGHIKVHLGNLYMAQIDGLSKKIKDKEVTLTLLTTENYGDAKIVVS
jgi:hypothetical protein